MPDSKIIEEWLEKADEDFNFATSSLDDPESLYFGMICFHYQQAIEKYLKAYIIANNMRFKKTHDLEELLNSCVEKDKSFEQFREECVFLTDFYVASRYPIIPAPALDRETAEKAKVAAQKIGDLVKSLLS